MSDWWSYRLSDFLLFSPETWHRLVAQYLRVTWPARLLWSLAGAGMLLLLLRRSDGRSTSAILGAAWLWVGWAFHIRYYATINWAAEWFGWIWILEGLLLIWLGLVRHRLTPVPVPAFTALLGIGLLLAGILGLPVADRLVQGSWAGAGTFGTMPDPTAVATLGMLLLLRGPRWIVFWIPLLWCLIGGATLLAMEASHFWMPLLAAALSVTLLVADRRRERRAVTRPTVSR